MIFRSFEISEFFFCFHSYRSVKSSVFKSYTDSRNRNAIHKQRSFLFVAEKNFENRRNLFARV